MGVPFASMVYPNLPVLSVGNVLMAGTRISVRSVEGLRYVLMTGRGIPVGSVAGVPSASMIDSNLPVLSVKGAKYVFITDARPLADSVAGLHSVSMGHASKIARCVLVLVSTTGYRAHASFARMLKPAKQMNGLN